MLSNQVNISTGHCVEFNPSFTAASEIVASRWEQECTLPTAVCCQSSYSSCFRALVIGIWFTYKPNQRYFNSILIVPIFNYNKSNFNSMRWGNCCHYQFRLEMQFHHRWCLTGRNWSNLNSPSVHLLHRQQQEAAASDRQMTIQVPYIQLPLYND